MTSPDEHRKVQSSEAIGDPASAMWDHHHTVNASAWPSNEVVRLVMKYYPDGGNGRHAVDVGCGTGANAWMLSEHGFKVNAFDISEVAIKTAYEQIALKRDVDVFFQVADIRSLAPEDADSDLVLDATTLCCLTTEEERARVVDMIYSMLVSGGRFFSIMPSVFSARDPFVRAVEGMDMPCTFWTKKDIERIYGRRFKIENIGESIYDARCGRAHLLIADMVKE